MDQEKGYIAHPIPSRDRVRAWEIEFEKSTGIELVNPFRDVERAKDEDLVAAEGGKYHCDPTEIVLSDIAAIKACDFVVAWVTGERSYGTIMEITYAYLAEIPVYIICTNGHETHPWLRYHATKIFTAPEQFERYMRYHHGPKS
jgi:nucleoside 2-deoxyribosyltransferase